MAAFLVVEITDCIHSQDDSFQHVPRGIILNALSDSFASEGSCNTAANFSRSVHTSHIFGPLFASSNYKLDLSRTQLVLIAHKLEL